MKKIIIAAAITTLLAVASASASADTMYKPNIDAVADSTHMSKCDIDPASCATKGGFAENHPYIYTGAGIALIAATQGIGQLLGGVMVLGGASHMLEPHLK